ncbi:MAG: response regulator, partial [Candidatus Heimdallarchaeota archaeon]|nr:response regulator [Candidatus Heimdallarchaeota archaeon]
YVKADQGQVEQVLMNLVVNARDAMVDGGRLALKTEDVTIDEQFCKLNSEARPGNFVCFSVEDSGIGMDKETISHIFEPFFTTKEVGTGLGLSVIYGIVKQHEGWINVYSEPGQGSTFKVYFPVISVKEDKKDEEKISIEELRGSGERVLLVEDDDLLIEYAKGALSNSGYKVFEVKNAKEALDIFEKEEGNFDIVFSDVVLPDKNGVELVEMLVSHKPGIKVLLISGYLDDKSQWAKIQEKGFTFIQKPYTMAELLKAIKDVIKPN